VVVLDHHPQTSELVGLALRQAGYQVEFAPDEDRLSRMMEAAPKDNPFRVLLVDLRMPHISGLELVRRLRSRYPHLRALMLFADPLESHAPELQHGEAHIDAPVTPAAVIEAVRLLLAPNPAA
jgi:CheY-like chemotaxis protein